MSDTYDKEKARLDIKNQKYRVQPDHTGLEWAEVYAKSEDEAINIVLNNTEFEYLQRYDNLEAYTVSKTLKQMIEDFTNGMPLDALPDEDYKARFEIEIQRLFGQQKEHTFNVLDELYKNRFMIVYSPTESKFVIDANLIKEERSRNRP